MGLLVDFITTILLQLLEQVQPSALLKALHVPLTFTRGVLRLALERKKCLVSHQHVLLVHLVVYVVAEHFNEDWFN